MWCHSQYLYADGVTMSPITLVNCVLATGRRASRRPLLATSISAHFVQRSYLCEQAYLPRGLVNILPETVLISNVCEGETERRGWRNTDATTSLQELVCKTLVGHSLHLGGHICCTVIEPGALLPRHVHHGAVCGQKRPRLSLMVPSQDTPVCAIVNAGLVVDCRPAGSCLLGQWSLATLVALSARACSAVLSTVTATGAAHR
jgi:hypothetical protein